MENEIINVSGGEMLEAINRSEIDGQIATAHKFPERHHAVQAEYGSIGSHGR